MRRSLVAVVALFAVGGTVPAGVLAVALLAVHAARDPERLLDAAYVVTFCALGYAVE